MKKLSKILVLVLSLALAISAFAIASSAEDAPFLVEGLYRENWADAIDNADENTPIELLGDYQVQDGETAEINTSVTIKLNGNTLSGANDGGVLFNVKEEGAVLKILGPGKISVNGTLAEVDAKGAALILDGEEGAIEIVNNSYDSAFVVGGENKATANLVGEIVFKDKVGANLIELASSSTLNIDSSSVTALGEGAKSAVGVVLAGAGAKVNITNGAVVQNNSGYIVKISETEESLPASVKIENSEIISSSTSFGSVVEFGGEYANVTIRASVVTAAGHGFEAEESVLNYEGTGKDKVYAAPKSSVSFLNSKYIIPAASKSDAYMFYGNLTGIVSGGLLDLTASANIAYGTRLWDGETGILIKVGVKLTQLVGSAMTESTVDEDGVVVYFDPSSETNKNFSLETVKVNDNGTEKNFASEIVAADIIDESNKLVTQYIVDIPENKKAYTYAAKYSTNFEDVNLYSAEYENSYGTAHSVFTSAYITSYYSSVQVLDNAEGSNRYLKLEYDHDKEYHPSPKPNGGPYFSLKLGYGGDASFNHENEKAQWRQDFITIDFDISSDFVGKDGNALYCNSTWALMQRVEGSVKIGNTYVTWWESNQLGIAQNGVATFGKWNELKAQKAEGDVLEPHQAQLPTTPGKWAHITIVMEIASDTNPDGSFDEESFRRNSKLHYFLDGVYVGSDYIFTQLESRDSIFAAIDVRDLNPDELRFTMNYPPKMSSANTGALCFDNFVMTFYPDGYDGDLSKIKTDKSVNLKELDDVVFKKGYEYPENTGREDEVEEFAATVDGVGYYNLNEALATIVEGSDVELFTDYEGKFNVNCGFTVKTNGFKFETESSMYQAYESLDDAGNQVFKFVKSESFIPVYWDINISYETKVPLGVVPEFTSEYLGYQKGNHWVGLIGWSYTEDSNVCDEILPVTKEDIDRGYIILYPVFDVTKVLVEFRDLAGSPIGSGWFNLGDDISVINAFNDGSHFATIDNNEWYYTDFTKWLFNGDPEETQVTLDTQYVTPLFNTYTAKSDIIKISYSIKDLVKFAPNIYILDAADYPEVEILGLSKDGKAPDSAITKSDVTIDSVKYNKYNLGASAFAKANAIPKSTYYLHYKIDGVSFTKRIDIDIAQYLETILLDEGTSDTVKTAIMDTMRMIATSLTKTNATYEKYLNDTNYSKYLTDLTKVSAAAKDRKYTYSDTTITYAEFYAKQTEGTDDGKFDGMFDHINRFSWNFMSGYLYAYADPSIHPNTTASGTDKTNGVVFAANYLGSGTGDRLSNNNISKTEPGWRIDLNAKKGEIGVDSQVGIVLYTPSWGTVVFKRDGGLCGVDGARRVWNLVFHTIYINDVVAKGGASEDVIKECNLTNAIYAAHASIEAATGNSGTSLEMPVG